MVDSIWLLDGVDKNLRNRFDTIREVHYNPNTKGGNYEKILAQYLREYLDTLVDFHIRSAILDATLEVLNIFPKGGNEFDVVATYKTATPKIVLKTGDMSYIPYDAVAFFIEVKQTLSKSKLEDDLKKYKKLLELQLSNRFRSKLGPVTRIDYPMKILFYYENEISKGTLEKILVENNDFWDILIIYQDNIMYANSRLPYIIRAQKILKGTLQDFSRFNEHILMQFIILIQSSLMYSHIVDTLPVFYKLLRDNTPARR